MTKTESLPLSGYAIAKVYITTAELRPKEPAATAATDPPVNFGWDWRRTRDKSVFEVRITLAIEPVRERPYYAAVDAIGRFRQLGDSPSPSIEEFVRIQAVAILMPYARQHLTNLTAATVAGPYYLPSVNVYEVMSNFDPDKTTAATEAKAAEVLRSTGKAHHGRESLRARRSQARDSETS